MAENDERLGESPPQLRFGLFDWIDSSGLELADLYEQRMRLLEYADEAGFYCYHLAEHHATPLSMAPSPNVFLAAAAQRTHRIRLGALVYLLPLYNPLRLTQEICMLDHLSQGRLELGVGRGVSPYELAFYNVDRQKSRDMFREALDAIFVRIVPRHSIEPGGIFLLRRCPRPHETHAASLPSFVVSHG